ncbi:anhydro-N-acetylmuramic acid kinase [Longibacter salinarum]|uniref:Anhydro-N-acetylmuramic acid kinase n=1 Tax=Longibacter salinarum TaxID=1850348 RepID=A0A2A8CWZ6_9BACT|nr:anhydro-N-acetylmuramic acid kinase [Longibacter salinarum]PEN13114.1 anhydro-N-acetylmuramic acid kinase [Longibacter salinarum]
MPLRSRSTRVVAGLMSGTSLDGVDAAITHLVGSGRSLSVEVLAFVHHPYPKVLRELILQASEPKRSSVRDIARLNSRLPVEAARAIRMAVDEANLDPEDLDLVGSHGQTIQHLPDPASVAGETVRTTLQADDPSLLAQRLGVPVVGDFRRADMALGGQGAPLAPYLDDVLFASENETRLLLNLGGIANLTVLPAGGGPQDLRAFDTGPANMVIDALAQRLFDEPYDPNGSYAADGTPDADLLADLLMGDYFRLPPPKSTGREAFGTGYVDTFLQHGRSKSLSDADLMATATMLTAASVYQAYARYIRPSHTAETVYVSGGGVHNDTLMSMLGAAFAPIPVQRTSDLEGGVDPDAKEAVLFAVLAHETANGVPTGLPNVTGARRPAIQGGIYLPPPDTGMGSAASV